MDANSIALFFGLAIIATFVQRVCGFGFGIFIMSMLTYIMPSYGEATTLSGLLAVTTSLYVVIRTWRHIDWRKLMPITITFIATSYIGIRLITVMPKNTLSIMLGIALILVGVYFLFFQKRIAMRPTMTTQISMGTISGLMGGACAMQGPPAVIYFLAATETKEQYIAITQAYFVIGNLIMTIFRAQSGFLTPVVWTAYFYGLGAVVIGNIIGALVFKRISVETLRKLVYIYLVISGIIALF